MMKKYRYVKPFAVSMIMLALAALTSAYRAKVNTPGRTVIDTTKIKHAATDPDPLKPDYTAAPMQEWEKKFTAFEFRVFTSDGHVLPYRFYRPNNLQKGKKYPLVLFMHGAGERGNDNRKELMRFNPVTFWEKYPCFIIAPQCPEKSDGTPGSNVWVNTPFGAPEHTMKPEPTWPMQLALELFKQTVAHNPIDKKRIYVTGLSMGGFATWEILQREPADEFAAAMPVCGGADLTYADKLKNLPLWVFHGGADSVVLTKRSRDMVAAIKAAGGDPKYTEYPGVGHGAWAPTYSNPQVWDWLFAQHKN